MPRVNPDSSFSWAINAFHKPEKESHKGQNGRLLVIGGSKNFHAASLWSAEVASRFVDLVHYSSTEENHEIFINLKSKFHNGIVVPKDHLLDYVQEDDCILIGPGMERGEVDQEIRNASLSFNEIIELENEAHYTYALIRFLIQNFPDKKFVFDAAALQMLQPEWLRLLQKRPILTPHSREFEKLFGINLDALSEHEIVEHVSGAAQAYSSVILLKRISDYVSDGDKNIKIEGGNEGLTKGGTGDALAGLVSAFNTTSDQVAACVLASYIVKSTAEDLEHQNASFYNTSDLIASIPAVAKSTLY